MSQNKEKIVTITDLNDDQLVASPVIDWSWAQSESVMDGALLLTDSQRVVFFR